MAPKPRSGSGNSFNLANSMGSMPPALEDYLGDSANQSSIRKMMRDYSDPNINMNEEDTSSHSPGTEDDDDDGSAGSDSSFSEYDDDGKGENLQQKAAKHTRKSLARGETRAVTVLRYMVLTVLFVTAILVSVATYFYSRSVEQDMFQAEFESVADVTLRSFVENVEHRLSAMDAMGAGVTSHAKSSGSTFPNVTIPDYEVRAATLRTQTDSIFSFWLPLVTDDERRGFEAYAQINQGHMFQSYMAEEGLRQYQDIVFGINTTETQATEERAEEATEQEAEVTGNGIRNRQLHVAPMDVHPVVHEEIWGRLQEDGGPPEHEGDGPFMPVWQVSPVIPLPSLYLFNFLAYLDLAPMLNQVLDTGKAALSYLQTDHTGSSTEELIRLMLTMGQYRHEDVAYKMDSDPLTQVAYPVFDSFDPTTKKVAGVIITTIFWRLLFTNVLPKSVQGVICVLSNTLGNKATYRLDGRTATYLGEGDLHDTKYDDMAFTRDISEYILERTKIEAASYTSVELDGGYTSYRIHVYPSEDMESTYVTTEPIVYAVVVACVFLFTSLVFMFYDWLVEKRQKKVMDKAVKSTAVVTSLFPEAVHERLFADAKSEEFSMEMNAWKTASQELTMPPTMDRTPSMNDIMARRSSKRVESKNLDSIASVHMKKGRPIADKFPNVTVLFADLAGFTQWSSTREPDEVFVLLEALYGAFDKVAARRQVFKVETIGDCYMACTGLPNPQPDHAQRMVKFARDCQGRMGRLLDELSSSLGQDTKELSMRIGLHSGPVTAGVLRGDKGRFQLFGDTVNTASRMESNGVKGRIHCSDSAAKHLPPKWLTMREDRITAKGKGEMITYFVDPGMGGRSSIGGRSLKSGGLGGRRGSMDGHSKHSSSHDSTSMYFDESERNAAPLNPQYLSNLGILSSHNNTIAESSFLGDESFANEPVPTSPKITTKAVQLRAISPALFGKSVAQKLGITEEVEI